MELTKDSNEKATLRDIRALESMMLAGFELCFAMLGEILENQKGGITLNSAEI